MALQRRSDNGTTIADSPVSLDCEMCKRYPDLAEFLGRTKWDDGSDRECGTVLVCCEDGRWKCWCNDKDAGLSCWVSGESFAKVLSAANKAVGGSGGDWRRPRPQGKRR